MPLRDKDAEDRRTQGAAGNRREDIRREWNEICFAISEISSKLAANPPQLKHLSDLPLKVAALEKLRGSLTIALEMEDHGGVLSGFAERVKAIAAESAQSPIGQCVEQIHAQWISAYPFGGERSVEALREDVARAERTLAEANEHWLTEYNRKAELEERLVEAKRQVVDARGPSDRINAEDLEADLQGNIAAVSKDLRVARDQVYSAVAPYGESFDPARDYRRDRREVHTPDRLVQDEDQEQSRSDEIVTGEERTKSTGRRSAKEDAHKAADECPREDEPSGAVDKATAETRRATTKLAQESKPDGVPERHTSPDRMDGGDSRAGEGEGESTPSEPAGDLDRKNEEYESVPAGKSLLKSLWRPLGHGRSGIAYHIGRLQADLDGGRLAEIAKVIAASTLARHTHADHGDVVNALSGLIGSIDPDTLLSDGLEEYERDAVNLMLFCASLRPALFAPSTGAASLLNRVRLPEGLKPLNELAMTVVQQGEWLRQRGVRHSAATFRITPSGTWQEAFDSFCKRVRDWQNRAESKRHVFSGADRVWKGLLRDDGCLNELCELVAHDDETRKSRIEEIYSQICDRRKFNELVRRTDQKGRKGNPIEGLALKQLWNDVQPVQEFGIEWQRLIEAKPPPSGFVGKRIAAFRKDLSRWSAQATDVIGSALSDATHEAVSVTLNQAKTTLGELRQIFDGQSESSDPSEQPNMIWSRDLVFVAQLDLDATFNPVCPDLPCLLTMLLDSDAHADSLRTAFNVRLERGDLVGALLTLDLMAGEGDPELEQHRESLLGHIERRQKDLRSALADHERQVEHAFCRGQVDADERNDMAAKIASMRKMDVATAVERQTPDEVQSLAGAFSKLSEIDGRIESLRKERVAKARARLRHAPIQEADHEANSIVTHAIDTGDLLTANEHISRMEKGEAVAAQPPEDEPFRDFLTITKELESVLNKPEMTRPEIKRRIGHRENIGGLTFDHLTEEEANSSVGLLEDWYQLARVRRPEKKTLRSLFQHLGFRVASVQLSGFDRGWPCATVQTDLLEDRALCPSRQFGSEAAGQYRVLLNWHQPADEAILRPLADGGLVPTIVLHLGCLGTSREKLRARAIQTHRLFLVVDEALILFLTTRASSRLPTFFRCSLPFSSADPYATTSGIVPPELFYGRKQERKAVMDQSGACFIYGGRQLGKTALLRCVERDFNRSGESNTRIAKWIDLKVNEIGYALGPSDVWPLLQRELRRLDVIDKGRPELDPSDNRQVKRFLDRIRKWLDERRDRRLLLLLDEADEFLKQDAKTDFKESARLKGLMDETERRFKVVFAGLHNVLRTTHQANHPLAHLGDPIRVGAMLSNEEWKEAQALVREPLQAVGCSFERHDLGTRILAQTNYYPSLIQIYGTELVRGLRDSSKTFPYEITDRDIDDTNASRELRSTIRERFLLTLQLDPRYEVIAYTLALELHKGDLSQGIDRSALFGLAQDSWPHGFNALPDMEFNMLLHEMEGLGVLQELENDRYTLRNPNILLLLGSSQDIEDTLDRPFKLPTVYEPKSFRARYPGDTPLKARRGPLTYLQESELRRGGVAVISGCYAAGLESVQDFLSKRIGGGLFQQLPSFSDRSAFESHLDAQQPARNEVTVYLIPLDVNWDATWLKSACEIINKKARGRRLWTRVAFIAAPDRLWRVQYERANSVSSDVDWISLGPCDDTFLRRWLDDINSTADDDHVSKFLETTGGWPRALDKFSSSRRISGRPWHVQMEKTRNAIERDAETWLRHEFGLSEDVEGMLSGLAEEDGPFDQDSIQLVADAINVDHEGLRRRVEWSAQLGLLTRTDQSNWTFNPLLDRLLSLGDTS